MTPRLHRGWLIVDCAAPDTATVEISVGGPWLSAFRDYDGGKRVAKVRVPEGRGRVRVKVRVNGEVQEAGVIGL